MLMHLTISIIFLITAILAFTEDYIKAYHKMLILAGYAVVMVFLATTKDIDRTADALAYEEMFLHNDDILIELMTEPTYIYLSRLVLALGGTVVVIFFVYALISIPYKISLLYAMTQYIFTALLIYIPVYFEVHDMIQIRVAAAATFLFASLQACVEKNRVKTYLLFVIAILFHYSSICYIPFLLFGNREINSKLRIALALFLPFSFMLYFLKMDLLSLIPSDFLSGKLDFYKNSSESGDWEEMANPCMNLFFMSKCAIMYLCLYYYDIIVKENKYAPILINLFSISLCFRLSMATIPVVAGRISDLYGIIDCIVFTFCMYLIKPHYAVRLAIMVVGIFMLIYNMRYTEYFI